MPIVLNGSGSISGLNPGGLPDSCVTTDDLADGAVSQAKRSQQLTLGTIQNSTSGTSIDFTSIPSWVKRVRVMLSGVSLSGTALIRFRLGTSGGVVSSGYLGAGTVTGSSSATANQTAGFDIYHNAPAAAFIYHGAIDFSLLDQTNNVWSAHGVFGQSSAVFTHITAGSLTLTGALTTVRITTSNGTDTFDAGSINILYE